MVKSSKINKKGAKSKKLKTSLQRTNSSSIADENFTATSLISSKKSNLSRDAIIKPKRQKARITRILKKREPLLVENTKRVLIFKGHHTSQSVIDILKDFSRVKKPNCKLLSRKNEILPFEDKSSIEFLASKNDCSLFLMGSHSKKRPNNLILGRTYDSQVLDMIEFGVDNFVSIDTFEGFKKAIGSKPLLIFQGDQWESDSTYKVIENLFVDFFRGDKPEKIALKGIDHTMIFSIVDGIIFLRVYTIIFKKSGTKVPNTEIRLMGPSMDLTVRRTQLAPDDLRKVACKKPKELKISKVKNISHTSLGDKMGRIHIQKQEIDKIGGKRMPVLRARSGNKSQSNKRARTNESE